jgi:Transposase IS200 like
VAGKFELHDFVVMPDPVHLLIEVGGDMTIERAMQLIKGGFPFRLRKEFGYVGEVGQRGFSEVRVDDRQSWISRLHGTEPSEGGAGGFAGDVSLWLHLFGKTKGGRGLKPANLRH